MKTLYDKKVNKRIRTLNRQLEKDVFGKRFVARQVKKERLDGVNYYLYVFIDNENPEANVYKWFSDFELCTFNTHYMVMNNVIVHSNFWEKYRKVENN